MIQQIRQEAWQVKYCQHSHVYIKWCKLDNFSQYLCGHHLAAPWWNFSISANHIELVVPHIWEAGICFKTVEGVPRLITCQESRKKKKKESRTSVSSYSVLFTTGSWWSTWLPCACPWSHAKKHPTTRSRQLDESWHERWRRQQDVRAPSQPWNEWCICHRQWLSSIRSTVWRIWFRWNARKGWVWFEVTERQFVFH